MKFKKKTGKKSDFSTLDGLPVHSPLLKKKKKSPLLMVPRLTYLENVRRDCNGYYFSGLII